MKILSHILLEYHLRYSNIIIILIIIFRFWRIVVCLFLFLIADISSY